jgi:hypothetical protein
LFKRQHGWRDRMSGRTDGSSRSTVRLHEETALPNIVDCSQTTVEGDITAHSGEGALIGHAVSPRELIGHRADEFGGAAPSTLELNDKEVQ